MITLAPVARGAGAVVAGAPVVAAGSGRALDSDESAEHAAVATATSRIAATTAADAPSAGRLDV